MVGWSLLLKALVIVMRLGTPGKGCPAFCLFFVPAWEKNTQFVFPRLCASKHLSCCALLALSSPVHFQVLLLQPSESLAFKPCPEVPRKLILEFFRGQISNGCEANALRQNPLQCAKGSSADRLMWEGFP